MNATSIKTLDVTFLLYNQN